MYFPPSLRSAVRKGITLLASIVQRTVLSLTQWSTTRLSTNTATELITNPKEEITRLDTTSDKTIL